MENKDSANNANAKRKVTVTKRTSLPKRVQAAEYLNRQAEIRNWIEAVTKSVVPHSSSGELDENGGVKEWDLHQALKDGTILCNTMKKLSKGSIPNIHDNPVESFKKKENICYFISAAEEFGVARHRLFAVSDLIDKTNFYKVLECLEDLAFVARQTGAAIWEPDEGEEDDKDDPENKTMRRRNKIPKWSEAQLDAAEEELRFVDLRPRRQSLTRLRRNSHNVRKSMALADPTNIATNVRHASLIKKDVIENGLVVMQAYARGRIARRAFQKRLTDVAYRQRIVREILETEIVYVNNLKVLVNVYLQPLKEAIKKNKPLITQEELNLLFSGSIEVILNYNVKFLNDLEPRVKAWNHHQKLGDVFLTFQSFMKVYTAYVKDFPKAQEMFDKKKTIKKFQTFLQECKQNPETRANELDAFLILPIQRIPRYTLLLGDLYKHTWPTHPDYKALEEALHGMQKVAEYINERKRESDNINKIWEIQTKLEGKIENLAADPKRRFVKEGTLTVVDLTKANKPRDRYFFLFNDRLICTKMHVSKLQIPGKMMSKNVSLPRQMGKDTFKVEQILDLNKMQVRTVEHSPTAFEITNRYSDVCYHLVAAGKEEMGSWITEISKAIQELDSYNARTHDIALKRSVDKADEVKQSFLERYQTMRDGNSSLRERRRKLSSSSSTENPYVEGTDEKSKSLPRGFSRERVNADRRESDPGPAIVISRPPSGPLEPRRGSDPSALGASSSDEREREKLKERIAAKTDSVSDSETPNSRRKLSIAMKLKKGKESLADLLKAGRKGSSSATNSLSSDLEDG